MPIPRDWVYRAIDSERNYQDVELLKRNFAFIRTPGEEIALLCEFSARARKAWTDLPDGDPAILDEVRVVAAIAVRCMERHGAPIRRTGNGAHR